MLNFQVDLIRFFTPKNLKSENNNPWFNILLHTQLIVCAIVGNQCLECLGYITLDKGKKVAPITPRGRRVTADYKGR